LPAKSKQMDKDQIEQRWDGTMGQTAISCTDRKHPGSLPELRLTHVLSTLFPSGQYYLISDTWQ
jgi:hypothetical protein